MTKKQAKMGGHDYGGDVTPSQAFAALEKDPKARLVDCRTRAEWAFVGIPDIEAMGKQTLFVSWQEYPRMQINASFVSQLRESGVSQDDKIYFICRSGARSRLAAMAMTAEGFYHCYNIANGFEGDHDDLAHRGVKNGWKADHLPWTQE